MRPGSLRSLQKGQIMSPKTWEEFQNLANETTNDFPHWSIDDERYEFHEELVELLETGSVTTTLGEDKYEITVQVKKVGGAL
jgi:membrane-bound lytic murein transglycosylase MltF